MPLMPQMPTSSQAPNGPPSGPPRSSNPALAVAAGAILLLVAAGVGVAIGTVGSSSTRHAGSARAVEPSTPAPKTVTVVEVTTTVATTATSSLSTYAGDHYTVAYPTGWTAAERGVTHPANAQGPGYTEAKWVDPSDSNVYALVDDTPGFTGTPHAGAVSVEKSLVGDPAYNRLVWGRRSFPHATGWQWGYTFGGDETVDTFFVMCGEGVAVEGRAPAAQFQSYAGQFAAMTASLAPNC
jgi:hypothetical protein